VIIYVVVHLACLSFIIFSVPLKKGIPARGGDSNK
jgi:hypothetical protein